MKPFLLTGGEEKEVGLKVNIKELDDVLLRDVGGKIKADGRLVESRTVP